MPTYFTIPFVFQGERQYISYSIIVFCPVAGRLLEYAGGPEMRQPGTNWTKRMPDTCVNTKNCRYHALLCISILIYAAALLARLGKLLIDPSLVRDATLYLNWVNNWVETGDFYFLVLGKPPLVPPVSLWSIKTLVELTGVDAETAGRTLSLFLGSLVPVMGFFFALRFTRNIRIALLSALLLIIHPRLVEFSVQPIRENWYMFFNAAFLFVLCEAVRKSTLVKWAGCGVFLALSAFSRFEGMEFAPVAALILLLLYLFKKISLKEMLLSGLAFGLGFGLTALLVMWSVDFDYRFFSRIRLFTGWMLHLIQPQQP